MKKAFFFFSRPEKKKRFVIEWMNDMWTLAEKKKTEKCQNFRKKK